MLKKIFSLTALLCLGVLVSCQGAEASNPTGGGNTDASNNSDISSDLEMGSDLTLLQFSPPQPGDTIAILHTSMGDITIRLFPEEAPVAYENFVTHARNGYYDGVIFHRVLEEFMIQGGDPTGTGAGGESIWGHDFGAEFSWNLRHFRGALAMAHAGGAMGSQFYIVHSTDAGAFTSPQTQAYFDYALENQDEFIDYDADGVRRYIRDIIPTAKVEAYARYGGTPHLDLVLNPEGHTVFGQVISGMDTVDAIATVEVDSPQTGRPVVDVVIESITVTEY